MSALTALTNVPAPLAFLQQHPEMNLPVLPAMILSLQKLAAKSGDDEVSKK